MPIICLEGPSAVGKSSTARWLAEHHQAIHIPEVNFLFTRPGIPERFWYYERQLERVQIARAHNADRLVILDGDPFQPVWYNRLYPAVDDLSFDEVLGFYRLHLERNTLCWPAKYVILNASAEKLRQRKEGDEEHQRRNFEKHLALVDYLPQYFGKLQQIAPSLVAFQEADTIQGTAGAVLVASERIEQRRDDLRIFDEMAAWVSPSAAV